MLNLSFSQLRTEKALETEKQYLLIEKNINNLTFNELNDTISFHNDENGNIIKVTTKRNGNIEYHYYISNEEWPDFVESHSGNDINLFFLNLEHHTSQLYFWKQNGIPQAEDDNSSFFLHDKDLFKAGRDLKIICQNSTINEKDHVKVSNYLDSIKAVIFKPSVGTYELKDTVVIDDFDGSKTTYSSTSYDSTFISTDANITSRKTFSFNEFLNTRTSVFLYKDDVKKYSLKILSDEKLENSYRLRDETASKIHITELKTEHSTCFKGETLTKDYTTFKTSWSQYKCDYNLD